MSRRRIGPYRINQTKEIGHGRSAAVYLATHINTQEQVALKLLHVYAPENDVQNALIREIQIIKRLSHPNIIRVLDVGFDRNNPYYTMNYAPGGNLRTRIPLGSCLSPQEVDSYLQPIAEALQHAHERGVMHCDLKPENILVAGDGHLLLADFGISRIIQSTQVQSTQSPAGTPTYMAPEQFEGKPRPASDQYALAILAYEWLAGEPPFLGKDMVALFPRHTFDPPPPLTSKNPTVSPQLEAIVMRALAKKPAERFPTVIDFAHAFHSLLQEDVETSLFQILSEDEIAALHSNSYYSCYMCYSDLDQEFAMKLYSDLQSHNVSCWLRDNVTRSFSGRERRVAIDNAIVRSDKFLLILTEHALADKMVENEVLRILNEEQTKRKLKIVPIYRDWSIMQTEVSWAVTVRRSRLLGNFEEWQDDTNYPKLLNRLLRDLAKEPTVVRSTVVEQDALPYLSMQIPQYYSCMIAYCSQDGLFAEMLYTDLRNNGVSCWFAPKDMKIGDKVLDTIEAAIRTHDKVLLILSEYSMNSSWVEAEVEAALDKERKGPGELIILPVYLSDPDQLSDIPWGAYLRRRISMLDFRRWKDPMEYERLLNRILRDLKIVSK